MGRWNRGEAAVGKLVEEGSLQQVKGAQANGEPWLVKARSTLSSAEALAERDAGSAYTLAYDAARFACTALLVQQGLRPTSRGGHYALEQAVRAQFGVGFKVFGALRRRRNELEYPDYPDEHVEPREIVDALSDVREILESAEQLVPHLGLF
jgi:uncharacterized protein (UPF0332 family)